MLVRSVPSNKREQDVLPEYLAQVTGVPLHRILGIRSLRNRIAHNGTSSVPDTEARRAAKTIHKMQHALDQRAERHADRRATDPVTHQAAVLLGEIQTLINVDGGRLGAVHHALNELAQEISAYEVNDDAVTALTKSVLELRRLAKSDDTALPGLARALEILGWALRKAGRAEAALPFAEEQVSVCRSLLNHAEPEGQADHAKALADLGITLCLLDRGTEAAAVLHEAVAIARSAMEKGCPTPDELPGYLFQLSFSLHRAGRSEEALAAADEAVRLETQLRINDPTREARDLAQYMEQLASCLFELGNDSAAESAVREAAAIYRQAGRDEPSDEDQSVARIVVYRPLRFIGAINALVLEIDGVRRSKIRCNQEITIDVEPGSHVFQARQGRGSKSPTFEFVAWPGEEIRITVRPVGTFSLIVQMMAFILGLILDPKSADWPYMLHLHVEYCIYVFRRPSRVMTAAAGSAALRSSPGADYGTARVASIENRSRR